MNLPCAFDQGYCVGPLVFGPCSETYGNRMLFIISALFYTLFQVASVYAPNTGAILSFRFLAGCEQRRASALKLKLTGSFSQASLALLSQTSRQSSAISGQRRPGESP